MEPRLLNGHSGPSQMAPLDLHIYNLPDAPSLGRWPSAALNASDHGRQQPQSTFFEPTPPSQPTQPQTQRNDILLPPPQVTVPSPSVPRKMNSPEKPMICCIICVEKFEPEQEHESFLKPCRICQSAYCILCIKDMFIGACKEPSRMPARCCNMIQLHVAAPYLTTSQAKEYRNKYEEWSTPNPLYCPMPKCSAFIPNRLIPEPSSRSQSRQRTDSVIDAPKIPLVACPSCSTYICTQCRQPSHVGIPCRNLAFGVDEETAAILKSWGYKRCPKCGNGVRRMLGCNHMQCLCGAQWCWVCQRPMDECGGNCYESEDENMDSDEDEAPATLDETPREGEDAHPTTGSLALSTVDTGPSATEAGILAVSPPRSRNLDAGTPHYWEQQGLNFGTEPGEEPPDRTWLCEHSWATAKVSFEESIKGVSTATGMECSRCWKTVYPEIILPKKVGAGSAKMVAQVNRNAFPRGRGGMRHRERMLNGGTNGRGRQEGGLGSLRQLNELYGQAIVDPYGNRISTEDVQRASPRPSSFSAPHDSGFLMEMVGPTVLSSSAPQSLDSVSEGFPFHTHPHQHASPTMESPFSFAYECKYCGMMVCSACKNILSPKEENASPSTNQKDPMVQNPLY